MDFNKFSVTDKPILDQYLMSNPYGICDFSFANLFIWQETYGTEFAIVNDHLTMRASLGDGLTGFTIPLSKGNLGSRNALKDAICALIDSFGPNNFKLISITEQMSTLIDEIMPGRFTFSFENSLCDYIYLSEKMISLSGKKLAAKRNHINKFLSVYGDNFVYYDIDETLIDECLELNHLWCEERNSEKGDSDFCAVKKALKNFDSLQLDGGALRVDGKIVAFTLGQKNNENTYNVLIEKSLLFVEGAYPMINREFASRVATPFLYINREEDLGIEGLKKAKMSYNPEILLFKGKGVLNGTKC